LTLKLLKCNENDGKTEKIDCKIVDMLVSAAIQVIMTGIWFLQVDRMLYILLDRGRTIYVKRLAIISTILGVLTHDTVRQATRIKYDNLGVTALPTDPHRS